MKSDTERKKYYSEKIHKKKNRLHVHLSKDLQAKMKPKKRAVLVRKGDSVKIMRGPGKGKSAKVLSVSTIKRKVYLEGIAAKTLRGREVPIAIEPSNLVLVGLESSKERKALFSDSVFQKKPEPKKEEPKEPEPKAGAKKEPQAKEKTEAKKEAEKPKKAESKEDK